MLADLLGALKGINPTFKTVCGGLIEMNKNDKKCCVL